MGWILTNDWVVYNNVNFGSGAGSFDARVSSGVATGKISIRLDSPTGTLVGTLTGPNTGGYQTYTTASCSVTGASGVHNLYLVFDYYLNLNWFKFNITGTPTPTAAPTPTPTTGICTNPVAISGHFIKEGAGEYCWTTSAVSQYINSWNLDQLDINGTVFTNTYVGTASLPAKVNGLYYIHYKASYSYSHFEIVDAAGVQHEAENGALSGGAVVATNHTGYSGSGFVAEYTAQGASTTFTVSVVAAGNYSINLRYSAGRGSTETISIYVNGVKIKQTSLPGTAGWDAWSDKAEILSLNAGTNTIAYKYDSGDTGWANLDYISVTSTFTINYIKNVGTNLYIDGSGRTNNGDNAAQWSFSGSTNQQWVLEPYGGNFLIRNVATNMYLDSMSRTSDASPCGQYGYSASNNQQWAKETYGSYFRFRNIGTNNYLDGIARTTNGSDLGLFSNNGSNNQQWVLQ